RPGLTGVPSGPVDEPPLPPEEPEPDEVGVELLVDVPADDDGVGPVPVPPFAAPDGVTAGPLGAPAVTVLSRFEANGFLWPKTSRCEVSIELASSATRGSLLAPVSGPAPVAGGGAEADFDSASGTASVATTRATATGHRRFARRSCQRSRKKEVMALRWRLAWAWSGECRTPEAWPHQAGSRRAPGRWHRRSRPDRAASGRSSR